VKSLFALVAALFLAVPAFAADETIPQPPPGPMRIPRHYLTGSSGPVGPASVAAEKPYEAMRSAVAKAASRHVDKRDPASARRVFEILDVWANAGALLDYDRKAWPQSWYQCEWSLSGAGFAAWATIAEPSIPTDRRDRVVDWLVRAARKMVDERSGPNTARNNHAYWRGLGAAVVGATANDSALFDYGVAAYRVGLAEIAEGGRLPLEVARRENAVHYQAFAIAPLVGIAELAARRGIDLHGETNAKGLRLADAIGFLLDLLDDPTRVRPWAEEEQNLKGLEPGAAAFAWVPPYRARFPSPRLDRLIAPRTPSNPLLGGTVLFPRG